MAGSIQLTGLASGLDTQSIVDQLMQVERQPLNKLYKKKQTLEWKRDDYRSMNTLLQELDDTIFSGVYKKANLTAKKVTSSNSDFVTATANADAANVSYKIENVTLATAARKITSSNDPNKEKTVSNSQNDKIDSSKSIWSQMGKFSDNDAFENIFMYGDAYDESMHKSESLEQTVTISKDSNGNLGFQLSKFAVRDGETIKIGDIDYTIKTSKSIENLGAQEVLVDLETGKVTFSKSANVNAGDTLNASYSSYYLEFSIKTFDENGNAQYTDFKFDASTSLNDMISKINNSNAGVNLFYDSSTDKVVAMRTKTGNFNRDTNVDNGNEFSFVTRDADGNEKGKAEFFATVLGLDEETGGSDATFTINGLETNRHSNTFTINGVTFTLKKDSGSTGESATINIATDTDSIVNTIKEFVNKYNEVIGKINDKLNEEKYKNYEPLTDEEKKSLSEKEIEKWEEKAKSGLLRRDTILSGALDKMRVILYSEVVSNDKTLTDKKYNQLSEIGITTTNKYSERGKLEIDEDKLRSAIEENPNAIYQLFMANGETTSEKGLARRLRDTISSTIKTIEERAGNSYRTAYQYTMGKELLTLEDQIEDYEDRLEDVEERYWKQYTALEQAMQELNSQSNMLYSYLGIGNSSK